MDERGRFGLGVLLVAERARTRELLFARKSARPGFEGNDQLTFPGGMVRPSEQSVGIEGWIQASLVTRVAAEVSLDLQASQGIAPLECIPPVIAAYSAKGRRRHTVILPFTLSIKQAFQPQSQDATIYDPGWRSPIHLWDEITPTNRLIAAYYLWPRLSDTERMDAKPSLVEALTQASAWAAEVGLPPPAPRWFRSELRGAQKDK